MKQRQQPTVHSLRAEFKRSRHWSSFKKLVSLCDPFDYALTVEEAKSDQNPKGIVRQAKSLINAQLDDYQNVGRHNRRAGPKQKRLVPQRLARDLLPVRFLEHALGTSTLYVCANPKSKYIDGGRPFLIVFDVDNHGGTGKDVPSVAAFINQTLGRNLWWERSTGGRGLHGWAVVRWMGSSTEYREWSLDIKRKLNVLLSEEGYESPVDVQGQPPVLHDKRYKSAGLLIKAPRLIDTQTFESFFNSAPQLDVADFSVLSRVTCEEEEEPTTTTTPPMSGTGLGRFSPEATPTDPWACLDDEHDGGRAVGNRTMALVRSSVPWRSSIGCTLASLQRLGDRSNWDTACTIYEEEGAATGPRTPERIGRFQRLHDELEPLRNASSAASDPLWFSGRDKREMVNRLRPLIDAHGIRRVDIDDLAVVALLFRQSIARNDGYVAYKGIAAFFAKAGKSISNERIGRLRGILVGLGIMEITEAPVHAYCNRERNRCTRYVWVATPNTTHSYEWY